VVEEAEWNALSRIQLKDLSIVLQCPFGAMEASCLPETLESFCIHRFTLQPTREWCIEVLNSISKKLKNLRFLSGVFPPLMDSEFAQLLPRALELGHFANIAPEAVHLMPNKTKRITFSQYDDLSLIQGFPSQLEQLELPKLTSSLAALLPQNLRKLVAQDQSMMLTEEIVKLLPRHLTDFSVGPTCIHPFDRMESLEALPPTLTYLKLISGSLRRKAENAFPLPVPPQSSSRLSRNLQVLEIGLLQFSDGTAMSSWLAELPRNSLRILHLLVHSLNPGSLISLSSFTLLQSLKIQVVHSPKEGWACHLTSLPPNLTRLSFMDKLAKESDITSQSLENVPKSVTNISIPRSSLVNASCLSHLANLKFFFFDERETPPWFKKSSSNALSVANVE
jgi:hypothetical protein